MIQLSHIINTATNEGYVIIVVFVWVLLHDTVISWLQRMSLPSVLRYLFYFVVAVAFVLSVLPHPILHGGACCGLWRGEPYLGTQDYLDGHRWLPGSWGAHH